MQKFILINIFIIFSLFLVFSFPHIIYAQLDDTGDGDVTLQNPLGEQTDPQKLIGQVINAVLGIIGSLALVMFIYGGLVWMTAAGNNEKIEKGKNVLIWATVGLVVIFSSYAIIYFIFGTVLGLTP